MTDLDEIRAGFELAGYRVERRLERGGPGVVFQAQQLEGNRVVALRLIDAREIEDPSFHDRFLRAAALLETLDHANVLPVLAAGEVGDTYYVTTEYVEGPSLMEVLEQAGPLDVERALEILDQVGAALDQARWSRGLVHGSLAPGYVLVGATAGDPREHALLDGFGLRRELPPGAGPTDAPRVLGWANCLAPEQLEGRPIGPRADVYALGCLLYECVTGEPPFPGGTPEAQVRSHLHDEPPSPRHRRAELPAALDGVIRKALAKWPEERYSTCSELVEAARIAVGAADGSTRATADERQPTASPPSEAVDTGWSTADSPPTGRLSAWMGKQRRWHGHPVAAIAALVLATIIVAGVAFWLGGARAEDASPATVPSSRTVAGTPDGGTAQSAQVSDPYERTSGALVRIDGRTAKVVARVAVPSPSLVAADGRSVWVLSEERRLIHVDVRTNDVTGVFDPGSVSPSAHPTRLAVARGRLWASNDFGGVFSVAPGARHGERRLFAQGLPTGSGADSLYAAFDSIWVSWPVCCPKSSDLYRVDPLTGSVLRRIGRAGRVVASGLGLLWAEAVDRENFNARDIIVIDTKTNRPTNIGPLMFDWDDLAVAQGAVWASSPVSDSVVRLDPRTGRATGWVIKARERIEDIAAGDDAIWIATRRGVQRHQLGPHHQPQPNSFPRQPRVVDLGGRVRDIVFAGDSLWATVGS